MSGKTGWLCDERWTTCSSTAPGACTTAFTSELFYENRLHPREGLDRQHVDGASWTDAEGERHPLTRDDILIVAPYSAHVAELSQRLPGARVGTVDRFQGQQAPVVIYSMASSSATDAPRGMSNSTPKS